MAGITGPVIPRPPSESGNTVSRSRSRSEVAVSVIVPTHNRAQYLDDCLRSLADQESEQAFEVIVVDNASTDATAEVIRAWCESDARFRGAHERRVGLSAAKNAGVELASGDLLLFADDDVVVSRGWIHAYRRFFAESDHELLLAGGALIPAPHDFGDWPRWLPPGAAPDLGELNYASERALGSFEWVWGGNMAVPAALFRSFGGWDESVGRRGEDRGTFEDVEFQERVRREGATVWFCPAAMAQHRIDRRTVTPRRVLKTAFARGRNDYWGRKAGGFSDPRRVRWTPRNLAALCGLFGAWLLAAAVLRIHPTRSSFEHAHAASFRAGYLLDLLRDGRESGLLSRGLGRGARVALELASALAPGRSGGARLTGA